MTDKEIVDFIDKVNSDSKLTNVEKLSKVLTRLKEDKDNPLLGWHVTPAFDCAEKGVTVEDIARDSLKLLRSLHNGECEDITQKVLEGEEF